MNTFSHFKVRIEDLPIHFILERGVGPSPLPLILSHGWPWTFWDFKEVIRPLSDPGSFGGDPADAFDIVVPSLPGYVFSTPVTRPGVNWWTTADLSARLKRIEHIDRTAVQGAGWFSRSPSPGRPNRQRNPNGPEAAGEPRQKTSANV